MTPLLSVVIPAYNVERYITQAIGSVLAQSLQDIEVIVVDDGSTDGTSDRIARFTDPRLRVVRQSNRGLSAARNAGIANAGAELIGFLDGDDTWLAAKADRHVRMMLDSPTVGITFSHSMYIDEQDRPTGEALFSDLERPCLNDMVKRNYVGNGSSPVVRRECFDAAGVFDEDLGSCEDWEMWVRILARSKFEAVLIPEVLTCYRVNPLSLSRSFDSFIRSADEAAMKIVERAPGVPRFVVREGRAATYRVAATKALHSGARREAIKLLLRSLKLCPWLPLVDRRTVATLVMVLLPAVLNRELRLVRSKLQARKAASKNSGATG